MKELKELREMLCDELKEYGRKGDISTGTLDVVDKLAHTIKNLDKIIEEDGYSNTYAFRRDSMGRYSRNDLSDKLRELMNESPDDRTRMEIKRLIDRM